MERREFNTSLLIQILFLGLTLVSFARSESKNQVKEDFVTECNPLLDCEGMEAGNLVPDPADCYRYYVCIQREDGVIEPSDSSVPCPDGFFFSSITLQCAASIIEPCVNNCLNLGCNPSCTEYNYELTVDPKDCSSYYECLPGESKLSQTCEEPTPYFDGVGCSGNIYDCCDLCTPYCKTAGTEVVDPNDCHSYYICTYDESIPNELFHATCLEGEYFDPTSGDCEEEGVLQCSNLCPS